MKKTTLVFILTILVLSCSKQDRDVHDHPELSTGQDFYNFHCARCHRESGMGQVIKGIPPVTYSKLTHSQLRKLIMNGHTDGKMNIFSMMPKDEARKISQYVSKLSKQIK